MARSSTSFRPKWKLGNTTVIRVPHALAPAVLQYAHDLDEKTEPDELKEPALAYRSAEDVEMTRPSTSPRSRSAPLSATRAARPGSFHTPAHGSPTSLAHSVC